MVHGEEMLKAQYSGTSGEIRNDAQTASLAGVFQGNGERIGGSGSRAINGRGPSVGAVVEAAARAEQSVAERVKALAMFAERAEALATKLVGSYPSPERSDAKSADTAASENSGFVAMQVAVERISLRSASADPALIRLGTALAQLERAAG